MSYLHKTKVLLQDNISLLIIFVVIAFFRTAVADWSYVPSGSMEPTLYEGDYVLVNKMAYGPSIPFTEIRLAKFANPQRGDIITFYPPHTDDQYVKRVIAVPGDFIQISGIEVSVNGNRLPMTLDKLGDKFLGSELLDQHQHLIQISPDGALPTIANVIEVPEGKYFVMGDHRSNSADSRYWGFVDEDKIMGKINRLVLSFSDHRAFLHSIASKVD